MSLGGFSKDKLIFDSTVPSEGDNVGSFVRAGTDGDLISSTNIGGKEALDVNLVGGADSGIFAEDSVHVSGDKGQFVLGVRSDAEAPLAADGDYHPFLFNSSGRLKVDAEISVVTGADKAEDSAHASGDIGSYVLAVRQDTLASSVSTDGDYASFKLNSRGALWSVPVGTVADDAADDENPVKVGWRAYTGPLAAVASGDRVNAASDLYRRLYVNNGSNIAIANVNVNVDNTGEVALPGSALAGRRTIMVQNLSNKEIYVGATGVTSANGFVVGARATISLDIGPDIVLYARGSDASAQALRVLELA